jgi:hypothetical protein
MNNPWTLEEMKELDLNDKRLNQRLTDVLSLLSAHPTASIPAACGGYAETAAAYRMFDNEKVRFDNVFQPHGEATRRRMAAQETVIVPQDTTELDMTRPEQQMAGAGPLDGGSRRGVFLHVAHAFTPDGTALGTVHARTWARSETPPLRKDQRTAQRKCAPIEAKESYRWIETFRHVCAEARRLPSTHVVTVADSEADIYELLMEGRDRPANLDWIVRACQDRALSPSSESAGLDDADISPMRRQVLAADVLFTHTVDIRGRKAKIQCEDRARRQPRKTRTAQVEVRAARVTLRPPWRADRTLPEVTVNVVFVREIDPPPGDVAVEWMLVTSLPIDDPEQVRQVIEYYCTRWMIEILFRTLKSGCKIEDRRFEHVDRFLPCLAVYLIVAWRTLYVCRRSRTIPRAGCEVIFTPSEWKAVWQVVRREPPPSTPPCLGDMVAMVAQLGGYVNRKRPDPPGPQTVWLGLQRVHDIALCWELFGPEARTKRRLV